MSASSAGPVQPVDQDSLSVEDLARQQGVRPVRSLDQLARDAFSSDQELEEFLAYTYAARRRDMA